MKTSFLKEIIRGKSPGRALLNTRVKDITLRGSGIDLGSKSGSSSYHRHFRLAESVKITYIDLHPESAQVLIADLEKHIPVGDNSQDFLLLMNLLEHLYDYSTCLSECRRILKPGGILYGYVPFLHCIHPDPDDFFRYTDSALKRIFTDAGFSEVAIEPLGLGPITAGAGIAVPVLRIKFITSFLYVFSTACDLLIRMIYMKRKIFRPEQYALGYFFIAGK